MPPPRTTAGSSSEAEVVSCLNVSPGPSFRFAAERSPRDAERLGQTPRTFLLATEMASSSDESEQSSDDERFFRVKSHGEADRLFSTKVYVLTSSQHPPWSGNQRVRLNS